MHNDFTVGRGDREANATDRRSGKRSWRAAIKWAERILFIAGVLLLGIYIAARIDRVIQSRATLRQFGQLDSPAAEIVRGSELATTSGVQPDAANADFGFWSSQRIDAYQETSEEPAGAPLGILRIARVSLVAPVLDGTDDFTLNHAVGRIAGTARPGQRGNVGIAGHRDSFFRKLKDVSAGDAIELQTLRGTDLYVVDQIQIVTPQDVDVLRPRGVPSLTLVTCYPFYYVGSAPQRYIVTAFLSQERKNGTGNSDSLAVISNMQKGERP